MQAAVTKSRLGELALNAAINIERVQADPHRSLNDLDAFVAAVKDQFTGNSASNDLRDETMFPYYSAALAKVTDEEAPTRTQFPLLLAEMLKKQGGDETVDSLERTKQFCLAFHEAMIRAIQHNVTRADILDGRVR